MMKPLNEIMRYWYELDSGKPNVTISRETLFAWIKKVTALQAIENENKALRKLEDACEIKDGEVIVHMGMIQDAMLALDHLQLETP